MGVTSNIENALSTIRLIPDYPIPGVLFRDITTLLSNADAFKTVVDAALATSENFSHIAGLEARGFILGSAMSRAAHLPFIPLRKKGKLPFQTHMREYGLEYGKDAIEVHVDAASHGDRILLVDDVLATGGTIVAGLELIRDLGAQCDDVVVILEIEELQGRAKIESAFPEVRIHSLSKA